MRVLRLLIALLLCLCGAAQAHPEDVSHLRVQVEMHRVSVRLTMNLLTLSLITKIDGDSNQRITPSEIAKAQTIVAAYLQKQVQIQCNGSPGDLGDYVGYECVWPDASTAVVTDQDASQRYVDFQFEHRWPAGVVNYGLNVACFPQLGELHSFQGVFQQPGQAETRVEFTASEPDFLYDTGWTEEDFIKANAASREFHPWALAFGVVAVLLVLLRWLRHARGSRR